MHIISHGQGCVHEGTDLLSMFLFWRAVAQFQKCMALESCNLLKLNAYINVTCCADDLCNTFYGQDEAEEVLGPTVS